MKYSGFLSTLILNLFLLSGISVAQEDRVASKNPEVKKNQVALDVRGRLVHSFNYARRLGDSKLSFGGALGFGRELTRLTFTENIWDAAHVDLFIRYQFSNSEQFDFGPTLMRYVWTDDCSDCTGTFVGVYSSASIGHKFIFGGLWTRIGFVDDNRHGFKLGAIVGMQIRLALNWGK